MKLGLGLALSKWGFRGKGGGDPLAHLPWYWRWKSHRGQVQSMRDCIVVSGAGSPEVNGKYYQIAPYAWESDACTISHNGDYWFWGAKYGSLRYFSNISPSVPPWQVPEWTIIQEGVLPIPSLTLIQDPQYAAADVWQDAAGTIPATEPGDIVQAITMRGSKGLRLMSVDNSLYAMQLAWHEGEPCIQKAGAWGTLWMRFDTVQPHDEPFYLVGRMKYDAPLPAGYNFPFLGSLDDTDTTPGEWNQSLNFRHRPDLNGVMYLGAGSTATISDAVVQTAGDTRFCGGMDFPASQTTTRVGVEGLWQTKEVSFIASIPTGYNRLYLSAEPYDFAPFGGNEVITAKYKQIGFCARMLTQEEMELL